MGPSLALVPAEFPQTNTSRRIQSTASPTRNPCTAPSSLSALSCLFPRLNGLSWPRKGALTQKHCRGCTRRGKKGVACEARRRRWFEDESYGEYGRTEFGPYPWERDLEGAWRRSDSPDMSLPEVVTFVSSEGVFTLRSRVQPGTLARDGQALHQSPLQEGGQRRVRREDEYMDPMQRLCLGAVFGIRALNGVSEGRYLRVDGFCRSVQMLSDVITDVVQEEGGEVLASDVSSRGLNERLQLTVVLPLLWGVPPKKDSLRKAIHAGGGIVHKCCHEWQFM